MKNELLFNKNLVHDSGVKHVSGLAEYTDDITEPLNTLYGAIGWSTKAPAKIKKSALEAVKQSEGDVTVATYLALTYTFHKKDFIRITVLYDRLNEKGQKVLDFISAIFVFIFSLFVLYFGWLIAYDSFKVGRTSSTILDVPSFLTEFAIPLCFGFLVIRVIVEIYLFLKDLFK